MYEKAEKSLVAGRECQWELPPPLPPPTSPPAVPCGQPEAEDAAGCEAMRRRRPVPLRVQQHGQAAVLEGCQGSSAGVTVLQLCPWESSTAPGSARGLSASAPSPWLLFPFVLVGSQ